MSDSGEALHEARQRLQIVLMLCLRARLEHEVREARALVAEMRADEERLRARVALLQAENLRITGAVSAAEIALAREEEITEARREREAKLAVSLLISEAQIEYCTNHSDDGDTNHN